MTAFVDTNVLLYAVSRMPGTEAKQARAWALIDGGDIAVSLQVLQEFYVQATRSNRPDRLPEDIAWDFVTRWRRFPVQETTMALLDAGIEMRRRHKFNFWDCMILAAAKAQGCDRVWTEDMDDGRIVDGMRIANPFR